MRTSKYHFLVVHLIGHRDIQVVSVVKLFTDFECLPGSSVASTPEHES